MNKGRDRRRFVTRRTPSAIATAAVGAPAAIRNQPKKPMRPMSVTRKAAIAERTAAIIKPKTKSYHSAVSNDFWRSRTHSLQRYPVGVRTAHCAQMGRSQLLQRREVSRVG